MKQEGIKICKLACITFMACQQAKAILLSLKNYIHYNSEGMELKIEDNCSSHNQLPTQCNLKLSLSGIQEQHKITN